MTYTFTKKSTKAWSWTRMRTVTQFYWTCTVRVFGETITICRSSEVVHNRKDRDDGLKNLIEGIKKGDYEVEEENKT